jgi:single-strand DNA-binding protein
VCKFALAVNRRVKKGDQWTEEASFIDVTAWGKMGEGISKYLTKGKQVAVSGELQQDRWEQDGQPRSKLYVNASGIQLLGGNQSDNGFQQARQPGAPAAYQAPAQESEDWDIPF